MDQPKNIRIHLHNLAWHIHYPIISYLNALAKNWAFWPTKSPVVAPQGTTNNMTSMTIALSNWRDKQTCDIKSTSSQQNTGKQSQDCWPSMAWGGLAKGHLTGLVIILPTQTMHYERGNSSNLPYICIVWSPQNGSHLMTPVSTGGKNMEKQRAITGLSIRRWICIRRCVSCTSRRSKADICSW